MEIEFFWGALRILILVLIWFSFLITRVYLTFFNLRVIKGYCVEVLAMKPTIFQRELRYLCSKVIK